MAGDPQAPGPLAWERYDRPACAEGDEIGQRQRVDHAGDADQQDADLGTNVPAQQPLESCIEMLTELEHALLEVRLVTVHCPPPGPAGGRARRSHALAGHPRRG